MSYQSQGQLENDPEFQLRVRASCLQQGSLAYEVPAQQALADGVLRDAGGYWVCFNRLAAAGPGIAEKAETPDGVDQSLVLDADLLALTQANWPKVSDLYFDAEGNPLT